MGRIARVGYFRYLRRADREIVAAAMERVAIAPLRRRQIAELSGGQRQRMFIARALAQQAELLMLDEPFAGLDAGAHRQLEAILGSLDDSVTVLLATHDLGVAERIGRVALLNRRLIGYGTASEVLVAERLAAAYGSNLRLIDPDGTQYALPDSHCDHGVPAGVSHSARLKALPVNELLIVPLGYPFVVRALLAVTMVATAVCGGGYLRRPARHVLHRQRACPLAGTGRRHRLSGRRVVPRPPCSGGQPGRRSSPRWACPRWCGGSASARTPRSGWSTPACSRSASRSSPHVRSFAVDLVHFLFGNVLSVDRTDLIRIAVVVAIIVVVVALFYKEMVLVTFDRVFAGAVRLNSRVLTALQFVLMALAIAVALQTIGIALVVTPDGGAGGSRAAGRAPLPSRRPGGGRYRRVLGPGRPVHLLSSERSIGCGHRPGVRGSCF